MRYIGPYVIDDLSKKMVFVGGPRQCGKTTFAQAVLRLHGGRYLNWDADEDRHVIRSKLWSDHDRLVVLDELHKLPRWKTWIKGVFDTQRALHEFLVTGSARLDVYRRGGDSLLGRYHYWRLHPFTLTEIPRGVSRQDALSRLMSVGGFPEPFLDNDEREARRWRRERVERVLRDDVRDLEGVRNIALLDLLVEALRVRVGSPIVLDRIAQDLQVAHKTLKHWLEVLERMYLIFIVRPYATNLARALQKPFKAYFFDNADVSGDEGARFENLVATHLLKRIHFLEDYSGERIELRYVRDKEKREVDFVVLLNGKPVELYEAKTSDSAPSASLVYFAERLRPRTATQVLLHAPLRTWRKGKLNLTSALALLTPRWATTSVGAIEALT